MGGRGASSGVAPRGGKTGVYGLELGGNPELESALKRTNPNYRKDIGYQENCQKCVYVFEMNMRGYNLQAAPTYSDNDEVMKNWDKVMIGQKFEKVGRKNWLDTKARLLEKINGYGKDSRSVIYVVWKNGDAHVFNAIKKDGKIRFVDPQIGKEVSVDVMLRKSKYSKTEISRIDNLMPYEDLIKECAGIKQKKHRKGVKNNDKKRSKKRSEKRNKKE